MSRSIVLAALLVILAGCSMFGDRSGTEEASYRVIEPLGEAIEVRRYAPRVAAATRMTRGTAEDDEDSAFMRLFDYISGANRSDARIAMTVPVETAQPSEKIAMTVPVETTRGGDGEQHMRFFLPSAYALETAPQPTDPRVTLAALPEQTLAVLRFTGLGRDGSVAAKTRELMTALRESPWRPVGEPVALFYDPPWTIPFLRRNEVAVAVER